MKEMTAAETLALAMLAGADAIESNRKKYFGMRLCRRFESPMREIDYCKAAKLLREEAEKALEEADLVEQEAHHDDA